MFGRKRRPDPATIAAIGVTGTHALVVREWEHERWRQILPFSGLPVDQNTRATRGNATSHVQGLFPVRGDVAPWPSPGPLVVPDNVWTRYTREGQS